MENKTPNVSRRMIGKVNIFDLCGTIEGSLVDGIRSYIESYIKECNFTNVVLNIQSVKEPNSNVTHSILQVLEIPKKSVVYGNTADDASTFTESFKSKKIKTCSTQDEVVAIFGKELLERDKIINFDERRKSTRLKSALSAKINFIDKEERIVESNAIITNISEDGLFAEYLDLKSSLVIQNLDYFKNITAHIAIQDINGNFPGQKEYDGNILRLEFTGNQSGIAIEFKK